MSRTLTDDMIRELCILTTRNASGRHFTEWSDHYEALEKLGFVVIYRPIHRPTGIPYSTDFWDVVVTEGGRDLVDANPELHGV